MKIAIVGCGIGGLAAACLGRKHGFDITVFEEFKAPRPVGSGLVLQPLSHQVFSAIGILDQVIAHGAKCFYMTGTDVLSKSRVLYVKYGPVGGADYGLGIHRASLFDTLYQAAVKSGVRFKFAQEIQSSAVSAQKRNLTLVDGHCLSGFDLVIDAAGARSPLSPIKTKPLPYGAVWATVDWPENTDLNRHSLQQMYRRASNMVGILPLGVMPNSSAQKAAFFWSLPVAKYQAWRDTPFEEWRQAARKLWPELAPFIEQLQTHDDLTLASYSHGTLRRPFGDRIVHIGDAAHSASPQLGQGANMALLDAHALMMALGQMPLEQALPAYARARKLHVGIYQFMSNAFTPMYQSDSRVLPFLRDQILAPISRVPPIPKMLTGLVSGNMANPLRGLPKV